MRFTKSFLLFTYNFTTDLLLSRVRLLVADTDSSSPIFEDDEVMQALYIESSQGLYISGQAATTAAAVSSPAIPQVYSVYRSAAMLLDSLASNKSRLAGAVQILDIKLDIAKSATMLRDQAATYRATEENAGHFAIAEWVVDGFTARERVVNQWLRLYGS